MAQAGKMWINCLGAVVWGGLQVVSSRGILSTWEQMWADRCLHRTLRPAPPTLIGPLC